MAFTLENIVCDVQGLLNGSASMARGCEDYAVCVSGVRLSYETFSAIRERVRFVGVTENFKEILRFYHVKDDQIPAGFCPTLRLENDSTLLIDLKRNINYGKNGEKRATRVLYSADCANPYEIASMKNLLANITTNPSIIYDRFLNNEKANIDHRFHTREEVLSEIIKVVGPGVDISVEINDPFASEQQILEEVSAMEEIISKYQIVVKVPHLGPINKDNLKSLTNNTFPLRYCETGVADPCSSHDIALMLREHGYRVNFTLMADGYQTALALQAKPYFINCFMRNRYYHSVKMQELLKCYEATGNEQYLVELRTYLIKSYYLAEKDRDMSLFEVKRLAEWELTYRKWNTPEGSDGLDQARDCLRQLSVSNLPDTRLIICSMAGEKMYPYIDHMLLEPEFRELSEKVIISAAPDYLCQFTSSPAVLNYNASFAKAVEKK